jgi:putative flippase GtrA
VAFCVAVISNFLLNRRWTFHHTGPMIPHFGRFFIVSLIGLGLNLLSFTLLHNVAGVEVHVSQLLAIFIVTPLNFVGSKWWAFR